ncbi:MAG TPA: hypothetical protein VMS01_12430 [Stellaceae bacterium]|nr:hypothetical protein [Stellaceae bacterium]
MQVAKAKWLFEQPKRPFRHGLAGPEFTSAQGEGRDSERRAIASQGFFVTEPEHQIGDDDIDRLRRQRPGGFDSIGAGLDHVTAIGKDAGDKPADVLIGLCEENSRHRSPRSGLNEARTGPDQTRSILKKREDDLRGRPNLTIRVLPVKAAPGRAPGTRSPAPAFFVNQRAGIPGDGGERCLATARSGTPNISGTMRTRKNPWTLTRNVIEIVGIGKEPLRRSCTTR